MAGWVSQALVSPGVPEKGKKKKKISIPACFVSGTINTEYARRYKSLIAGRTSGVLTEALRDSNGIFLVAWDGVRSNAAASIIPSRPDPCHSCVLPSLVALAENHPINKSARPARIFPSSLVARVSIPSSLPGARHASYHRQSATLPSPAPQGGSRSHHVGAIQKRRGAGLQQRGEQGSRRG